MAAKKTSKQVPDKEKKPRKITREQVLKNYTPNLFERFKQQELKSKLKESYGIWDPKNPKPDVHYFFDVTEICDRSRKAITAIKSILEGRKAENTIKSEIKQASNQTDLEGLMSALYSTFQWFATGCNPEDASHEACSKGIKEADKFSDAMEVELKRYAVELFFERVKLKELRDVINKSYEIHHEFCLKEAEGDLLPEMKRLEAEAQNYKKTEEARKKSAERWKQEEQRRKKAAAKRKAEQEKAITKMADELGISTSTLKALAKMTKNIDDDICDDGS